MNRGCVSSSTVTEAVERDWSDRFSGRERVRRVVETLRSPESVDEIAERADVSWNTADSELQRLKREDVVVETVVDGKKAFDVNPRKLYVDEVLALTEENSRGELEERLADVVEELEELRREHDVDSGEELRQRLVDPGLSSEEMRSRLSVVESFQALETERNLLENALELYPDLKELNQGASSGRERSSRV